MSLAKRLHLLILAAALGVLVVIGVGYTQMERVFQTTNYGNINAVPSLITLNGAMRSFAQMRIRVYQLLLNKDPAKINDIESKINQAKAQVEEGLRSYENLISDERDRELLNNERRLLVEYSGALVKLVDASRSSRPDVQIAEVLPSVAGAAEKLNNVIEDHLLYNQELAKKASEEALPVKGTAVMLLLVLGVVTLGAVWVLGTLTLRAVLRQLGGEPALATELANQIGKGDLSGEIAVAAGDTTSLLSAMKTMQTNLKGMVSEVS